MVSYILPSAKLRWAQPVLILIVVEDGLVHQKEDEEDLDVQVLILIVVEDGLVRVSRLHRSCIH